MELHERFIQFSTLDLSLLKVLGSQTEEEDPLMLLDRFISYYNVEVTKNNADLNTLEMFCSFLCHKYQVLFHCSKEAAKTCSNPQRNLHITESIIGLLKNVQHQSKLTIYYDIILLDVVLHCNTKCVIQHLASYCKTNNNEVDVHFMKILECFLRAVQLRDFLYNDVDVQTRDDLSTIYIKGIITWLAAKEEKEWHLFASIFPRVITFFGANKILPNLWEFISCDSQDSKDVFALLCIIADISFPLSAEDVTQANYNLCYSERMGHILLNGLRSPIQQYRKQALFLLRKVIKFISGSASEVKKLAIIPFLCNAHAIGMIPMKSIQQHFFLVYEALEEKQQHLIMPVLAHIPTLIEGYKEHDSKHNCFNIVWIEIIFHRMLQHENNAIVKQGMKYVCDLDELLLNDEFCELLFRTLNNTYLYEFLQDEPVIILSTKKLLCSNTVQNESNFLAKILHIISEIEWAPIPLFYTIELLEAVFNKPGQKNPLRDEDFNSITTILKQHLSMHSSIVRNGSQVVLLELMTNSITKVNNFVLLINTLYEFSSEIFYRDSLSWIKVIGWLKQVLTPAVTVDALRLICANYSNQSTQTGLTANKFALAIVLLHDAKLIFSDKACPAKEIVSLWLFCLKGIEGRPYADFKCALNAIEFISHLTDLSQGNLNTQTTRLLLCHVDSILKFLLKKLKTIAYDQNYENVEKYINVTRLLLKNMNLLISKKDVNDYLHKYLHESNDVLANVNEHSSLTCLCALHISHVCQSLLNIKSCPVNVLHVRDLKTVEDISTESSTKGKVISECYLLLMKMMHRCLNEPVIKTQWAENVLHLFEFGGKEIIPATAILLQAVVDNGLLFELDDRSNFESIFEMCWRHTFLDKRNALFWPSITNLVSVIVSSKFLMLPESMGFVKQFINQLLEESENLPKLKRILLQNMSTLNVNHLKLFQEPLISCLTHGFALRRDKKVENQAYLHIKQDYSAYFSKNTVLLEHNIDARIRAHSTILLHALITADLEYASVFLEVLLKHLAKYHNKRYYNHSYVHKVKHRIMQVLLLLQPALDKTATVTLQDLLSKLILSESNQHSVRLMQEWLLIRIYTEQTNLHANLWQVFEEAFKVRPGCTSSIISIVYHTALLLPSSEQSRFIETGLKYIARCCLGQQFSMRLYGQVVFIKLYELLVSTSASDVISKYLGLYEAALASIKEGNLMKNSIKIQDDFYLNIFHPVKNYTLETIYYHLPRLSDIDQSEWIDPEMFKELAFAYKANHPLQLRDTDLVLSETRISPYLPNAAAGNGLCKNDVEANSDKPTDIQKKIDVSTAMATLYDDLSIVSRSSICTNKLSLQDEGLIIVASLIDRLPNLGGLARTCEIFRAKELIISNLSITKEKEFQSLSVSADKWITITEVKAHQVQEYMLKKKNDGWNLVGIEQTAYSTNLKDMKFHKKTVLVLGNEKDGVPANLIPLFDTCIEIPQAGIIRSLNVHVTGAICIWEYARQHIFKEC